MNRRRGQGRKEHTSRRQELDFLGIRRVGKGILNSRKAKREISKIGE